MSAGERVIIEVKGRRIKALRVFGRLDPSQTPAGQATMPPREYQEVPADLDVSVGDEVLDEEEDCPLAVIHIRRPRKISGHIRELILRCG